MTRGPDRRQARPAAGDTGAATVEFITVGVLLFVPLVYLVIAMGRVQAASFAVDSSAREAARAFVTAVDERSGRSRAEIAVDLGLRDQGFTDLADHGLSIGCQFASACLTPGARVSVDVTARVALPGVPASVARSLGADITVRSTQTAVVDEFRTQVARAGG